MTTVNRQPDARTKAQESVTCGKPANRVTVGSRRPFRRKPASTKTPAEAARSTGGLIARSSKQFVAGR